MFEIGDVDRRCGVVTGCADIKLTAGMWQLPSRPAVGRQQDETADDARNSQHRLHPRDQLPQQEALIRCNATDERWRLTCRDNSWVGQLGNCSSSAAKRENVYTNTLLSCTPQTHTTHSI